jgi:Domain of unknown function (DUF4190)
MGPYHPYPRRPPANIERTESKAVVSLVLGIVSMGCAGPFAGVPAIILGSIARRDIDRSNGTLTGRALAAGGIVSGLFGTGLGIVLALATLGVALSPEDDATNASLAMPPATTSPVDDAPTPPPPVARARGSTRSYGSLEVVDLDDSRGLGVQLAEITQRARGRTVVLQTYVRASPACDAIAAALPDKQMQRALANVTLVRVDIEEYNRELQGMTVETQTAPWFYKLDGRGFPMEALSADAWEANVPENMAPVLARFVHHAKTPPHSGSAPRR